MSGYLARAGPEQVRHEGGLDGGVCLQPLHNDLDTYAVAFAIRDPVKHPPRWQVGKNPFWQQALHRFLKLSSCARITVARPRWPRVIATS